MKGGSVLAHVTDLNDAAAEESAPFCRAKKPTKGSEPPWNPAILGGFRGLDGYWLLMFWGRNGNPVSHSAWVSFNHS